MSKKNLYPAPGKILVEKISSEEGRTKGGIILTNNNNKEGNEAIVISLGDSTNIQGKEIKYPVKTGQRIIYKWGGDYEISQDDHKTLVIVDASNVVAWYI